MLLNHHEFAFEEQDMKETVNMLVFAFYIVHQARLWLQLYAIVGRSLIMDNIFCSRTIVLRDTVAFLQESYTFVYVMFLAAIFLSLDV